MSLGNIIKASKSLSGREWVNKAFEHPEDVTGMLVLQFDFEDSENGRTLSRDIMAFPRRKPEAEYWMTGDNVLVQFRSADKRKAYLVSLRKKMAEAGVAVEVREPKAPAKVSRLGFMSHTVYRTIGDMVAVNMVLEKAAQEKETDKKGDRNEEAQEEPDAR